MHLDEDQLTAVQPQLVSDSARAWAAEQRRQFSDLPLRVTLLTTTAPVTDASRRHIKARGMIHDAGTVYGTGLIRLRAQ